MSTAPQSNHRSRWFTGGCLLVVLALAAAACSERAGSSPPRSVALPKGVTPIDMPRAGPMPPTGQGIWVGAWVEPTDYTQPGRVAATLRFEQQIGRQLDVVHTFHRWAAPIPMESEVRLAATRTLMVSWAGTDTRLITSGSQDSIIRAQARGVASLGSPVLLRWRWEMDRPNLRASIWSAADYVAAWRHIYRIFEEERVTNVGWVWCPHAEGFSIRSRKAADFYPGDRYVDWLCADVYADSPRTSFAEAAEPFLKWASKHPKPIIIGEFGVRRGERARWIKEAFRAAVRNRQIKAMVYFNGRGPRPDLDHRLQGSSAWLSAFAAAVERVRTSSATRTKGRR